MTAVDAVLFDLDDTLCEYRRPGEELLALAFESVGVDPLFTAEEYYARHAEFVDGSDGVEDLRSACFAAIARERGHDPDLGRAVARAYAAERDHGDVRPLPGALEAIETLSSDHRVGLVTNGGPEMQGTKLEALGLADAFGTVVHAGYDAPAKPAPDPFHRALDDLAVATERAVHVGNSLRADVSGAKAAGLGAAWLAGNGGAAAPVPEPDYVLDSPRALCEPPW